MENYWGEELSNLIDFFNIKLKGVLHVGAHKCEELPIYTKQTDNILWIEAIPELVEYNKTKHSDIRILNEVIGETDNVKIEFKQTNNTLSSSVLSLKEHKQIHPSVEVSKTFEVYTKTLKTILNNENSKGTFNLLVLDIQGSELNALKGLDNFINDFEYIYTEVNEVEVYDGCSKLNDIDEYLGDFNFQRRYLNILNGYGDALYIRNEL